MAELEGISAEEVRRKVKSGKVLPVCAYDEEKRFRSVHVGGPSPSKNSRTAFPPCQKIRRLSFIAPAPRGHFCRPGGPTF